MNFIYGGLNIYNNDYSHKRKYKIDKSVLECDLNKSIDDIKENLYNILDKNVNDESLFFTNYTIEKSL